MHKIKLYAVSAAAAVAVAGLEMTGVASAAVTRGPSHSYGGSSYNSMSHSNNGNDSNNETLYSTIQAQEGTELAQTSQTGSSGSRANVNQTLNYYDIFLRF
jgi:hypothetical protein